MGMERLVFDDVAVALGLRSSSSSADGRVREGAAVWCVWAGGTGRRPGFWFGDVPSVVEGGKGLWVGVEGRAFPWGGLLVFLFLFCLFSVGRGGRVTRTYDDKPALPPESQHYAFHSVYSEVEAEGRAEVGTVVDLDLVLVLGLERARGCRLVLTFL